jgi:hypothetical protein
MSAKTPLALTVLAKTLGFRKCARASTTTFSLPLLSIAGPTETSIPLSVALNLTTFQFIDENDL